MTRQLSSRTCPNYARKLTRHLHRLFEPFGASVTDSNESDAAMKLRVRLLSAAMVLIVVISLLGLLLVHSIQTSEIRQIDQQLETFLPTSRIAAAAKLPAHPKNGTARPTFNTSHFSDQRCTSRPLPMELERYCRRHLARSTRHPSFHDRSRRRFITS